MKLFNRIFRRRTLDKRLQGVWFSDVHDKATKTAIGNVWMAFTSDGKLQYDIIDGNKLQRMDLIYWTSGDMLYSDQPSKPRRESTKYRLENADVLLLEYNGEITKFIKQRAKSKNR